MIQEHLNIMKLSEEIASKAHANMKRKNGQPYIEHPRRVANSLLKKYNNPILASVGWLHDVIEDTNYTAKDLVALGIPEYVVNMVQIVSRNKYETYFDFILRISENVHCCKIKLADLEDNMSDLEEGSLKDKYRFAHYTLTKIEKEDVS